MENSACHQTADVSPLARIGPGTRIWHQAQVREQARVGANCVVGKGVYIDSGVIIGNNVKIQNYATLYRALTLEDGVFIGPHVVFANDRWPRAINPDGSPKTETDWTTGVTLVRYGASIGARSVVLPGVTIGRFALVGAGGVVTRDVPDHGLVVGQPAMLVGYACACGRPLDFDEDSRWCTACGHAASGIVPGVTDVPKDCRLR
jgi:UDP-2-acetamido-3-amino-2,3-dideoxy-glucuronate N-acetyltransferase